MIWTGSMTEMEAAAPATPEVPDKLYFRIGEVSRLVGVPAHVLRFWETEFPVLAPKEVGNRPPAIPPQRSGAAAGDQATVVRQAGTRSKGPNCT